MTEERKNRVKEVVGKRQLDAAIILENVTDFHNISAVLRTADSVGISTVYVVHDISVHTVKNYDVSKRTSASAKKWIDIEYFDDIETCVKYVRKKYKTIIGTAITDKSISLYEADFTDSFALMMGNEKDGLSENAQALLDVNILIPQVGMTQSLNISVACAVCMYEMYRQREQAGLYKQPFNHVSKEVLLNTYMERAKKKR